MNSRGEHSIDVVIVGKSADGRLVRLEGQLTKANARDIEEQLFELGRERGVVIDLSDVLIDSWGIGALLRVRSELAHIDQQLRVRSPSAELLKEVEKLGLGQIIESPPS